MPLLPLTFKLALALSSCALIFSGLALAGAAFSRQPEWIAMSGLLFVLAVLGGGVSLGRRVKERLRNLEEQAANRAAPEAEPFPALERLASPTHSTFPMQVPAESSSRGEDDREERRLQRLEMLERLREGIVHDLNNKLLVISANIDSVARHLKDQPALQRKLLSALVASDQAASLIARSNAFARGAEGDVRYIDLAECVESTATLMNRSLLRDTVELRVSLESGLWPVQADSNDLEMAIMTLSAYVRDALHQGGAIVIEARNAQVQKGSLSNLEIEGDFVQLVIASSGAEEPQGGRDETVEHAFSMRDFDLDAWLTLNRGLRFLHPLGGTAEVRNAGSGLAITLYLPRADALVRMMPSTLRDEFNENQTVEAHTEILVIDDEVEVALALQAMLEQVGYVTRIATDARQVMKTLKARKPGLVLADVAMHGTMNGVMLAREIRQVFPDLPVLLITGSPSATEEEKEFPLLLKPIVSRDLHAAIQRQLSPPAEGNVVSLFSRPSRRSS